MKKLVFVALLVVAVTLLRTAFPSNSDAPFSGEGPAVAVCGYSSGYAYPAYGWGSYYWPASYGYGGYGTAGVSRCPDVRRRWITVGPGYVGVGFGY